MSQLNKPRLPAEGQLKRTDRNRYAGIPGENACEGLISEIHD